MEAFKAALGQYLVQLTDFATLDAALERCLHADPANKTRVSALLDELTNAGTLPPAVGAMLARRIEAFGGSPAATPSGGLPARDSHPPRQDSPPASTADAQTVLAAETPAPTPSGEAPQSPRRAYADAPASPRLGVGSVLRNRFELVKQIGKGGMGTVYKALDLHRVASDDRQAFVALKVLNEDFKRHPESLRSLQRESRRSQDLAHPNIVTVFDFDHDGDEAYIQMEYLDGEPLDGFIRRYPSGAPRHRAFEIIEDLGRGLDYAHRRGIIHSDFKPSNAFITEAGVIKIFDFGIARAAQGHRDTDTVFDAGTLGALTPAYASCEMHEGGAPDAADDVYALALVTYELLSGRHPFDRKSAVEARDAGLVPAPLSALSRRQWRALAAGLAFGRRERTPSVTAFVEGLRPRSVPLPAVGAATAAVVVLALLVTITLRDRIAQRRIDDLVDVIQSGTDVEIAARLREIHALSPDMRSRVFVSGTPVQDRLVAYYTRDAQAAFDTAAERYGFERAAARLTEADAIFPDSAEIARARAALQSDFDSKIAELYAELDLYLERGLLVAEQSPRNVVGVLTLLGRLKPDDPRLDSPLIPIRFAQLGAATLESGDLELARALVSEGRRFAPQEIALVDLEARINRDLARERRLETIALLEGRLVEELTTTAALSSADGLAAALSELGAVDAANPHVARARAHLQGLIEAELQNLLGTRGYDESLVVLTRYQGVAGADFLARQRTALDAAATAHLRRVDEILARLDAAIAAGRLTGADSATAGLEALAAQGVTQRTRDDARARIAIAFAREAARARDANDWLAARGLLERGLALEPPADVAQELRTQRRHVDDMAQLASARDAAEAERRQAARGEQVIARFDALVTGPRFTEQELRLALASLEDLDRQGIAVDARRQRLVQRLLTQMRELEARREWGGAIALADTSAGLLPDAAALAGLGDRLRAARGAVALAAQRSIIEQRRSEVERLTTSPARDAEWDAALRDAVAALASADGVAAAEIDQINARVAAMYVARAAELRQADRLTDADQQLDSAASYAPELGAVQSERALVASRRALFSAELERREHEAEIAAMKETLAVEIRRNDVEAAAGLLRQLNQRAPGDPFVLGAGARLVAEGFMRQADSALTGSRFEAARTFAGRAVAIAPALAGHAELASRIDEAEYRHAREGQEAAASRDRASLRRVAELLSASQVVDAVLVAATMQDIAARDPDLLTSAVDDVVTAALAFVAAQASSNRDRAVRRLTALVEIFPGDARVQGYRLPAAAPQRSEDPCALPSLIGAGSNRRATCRDTLPGGTRGPALVVVPAGGPFTLPTAISKYEIAVVDYNNYCRQSGACTPRAGVGTTLPLTGITTDDAEGFVRWLSEQSGATYRLPTAEEWIYAATAGGRQPPRNFNCRVRHGGQLIKGIDLLPVKTGEANGWGLHNYVGNAREWVQTVSGWEARGGAHTDNLDRCDIQLSTEHAGGSDNITGFRVVRELRHADGLAKGRYEPASETSG